DLDGTLIDSVPDIHHNINILLQEEGLSKLTLDQTTSFVGNGSKKLVERAFSYFNNCPDNEADLDMLTSRFIKHYMKNLTDNTTIYPHVADVLKELSHKGHTLSICTNKPLEPTIAILKDLKLLSFFKIVTGGDSYAEKKPHPEPLLKTIEQVNIPKNKCIMIGDSIYDIKAGKAAGVHTVLLTYGYMHGNIEDIDASYICHNFDELTQLF
ncbi:phosphoglycolate phosphatase, partial [Curvivirga aplysinae]|uniref:phosphoglycolate phosphatase n=1 Tax=Curvivirga aplysinae TaxID=2529852 RepID=UPI0012BCBE3C